MFDAVAFKDKLAARGISLKDVAAWLDIDESTLWRKMYGHSDFYRDEIQIICDKLGLNCEDRERIFFA